MPCQELCQGTYRQIDPERPVQAISGKSLKIYMTAESRATLLSVFIWEKKFIDKFTGE